MLKSDAAAFLAGVKQVEGAAASAPTNLHVITGEVGTTSEDGKTTVSIDGLVFSEADSQEIQIDTLGGLEEGDIATIILTGESGHGMTPLAIGGVGSVDRLKARVVDTELLLADKADIDDLEAATARIGDLEADHVSVDTLEAATARIEHLEVDHVSIADFEVEQANIDNLQAATADIDTIRANSAKVQNLTAAQLEADHATVGSLSTTYATIANLNAANGRITNLESSKANISDLEADYITADEIEATYMHANMSNSDVAWIENGTIKNGAIVSAMINDVSANKLTAGTINGSVINVTNLNADNITTGTINGQRIGEGSLSLSKLEDDVYTETEVDAKLATMQAEIDGAIETWTGTAVPTLNNYPASSWQTSTIRDTHVGDVYFVVNPQSQQNGYNYRFTKSGSTYSWQLIKDSDVTNALQRLSTAEGKITTFDSDISTLKTDTGSLTTRTTNLETRMSDAEDDILDKVDTTTFNEVSDTVDQHSQTISQHTTAISNKADSSTVTAVTNRVSKNEQDISGINTTIGELQDTVESKADGSTVSTISNKLNTVSDTVDGHTQTLTSVQNTLSSKADSSTVSTISTKVNNVSDTVDGHTSQLSSITSTQTTMQTTLDKTVKSSIQLWYSKANTTAPSKPTSKVTSTSTSGNAWRIVVPAYNSSYPHYYYCWQYEYTDGTYGWSAVVRDIAMGESQSTARTADSNASAAVTTANTANTNASTALSTANTANTNASDAKTAATTASTTASEAKTTAETAASDASTAKTNAASAVTTANSANTTATNAQNTANANIKSSAQLWFTKANSTAPNKPTSVVSTSNANTANAWNLVVPVWNKNYPHYFYCYQQQKGDGNYQWTDVVYDRATSEAQQLANTTSTNLSTLQTDYATFKQTTEQFESTVGTTYATKTELKGATDDITELEGRVSTNETSISNNASAIALKANSSDVYTKSGVDGLISTEVTNRNAAITAKANEITSTVSQTYTTKTEFNNLEIGGRNLLLGAATQDTSVGNARESVTETEDTWLGCKVFRSSAAWADIGFRFDIQVVERGLAKASDVLTYSIWAKTDDTTSRDINGVWMTNKAGGTHMNGAKIATLTSEWTRYEKQITVTQAMLDAATVGMATRFECNTNCTSGKYIYWAAPKLEKGNKATDWTPAPEDVDKRVEKAESAITQNATNINAKVSKNDVINQINLSTEGVLIGADRVEINGAAVFSAIKSQADAAYDAKNAASTALSDAKTYADEVIQGATGPLFYGRDNSSGYIHLGHVPYAVGSASNYSHLHLTGRIGGWGSTTSGSIDVTFKSRADNALYNTVDRRDEAISTSFVDVLVYTGTDGFTHYWIKVNSYWYAQLYAEFEQFVEDDHTLTTTEPDGTCVWKLSEHTAVAATKSSAVKRTQRIWYRKSSSGAPSTPGTASSNWVTKADDGNDAWTKMHIAISSTHKYIYTCEQYEMADGTVGYTSVLLDNTITVIDGGNIITGSVAANKLDASDINASKSLTVGAMTDAAAATILNSNVQVGGRNFILRSGDFYRWHGTTSSEVALVNEDGGTYATITPPSVSWSNISGSAHRPIELLNGKTVTISCDVRGHNVPSSAVSNCFYMNIQGYANQTTASRIGTIDTPFPSSVLKENEWVRISKTLTFDDDARKSIRQIPSGYTYENITHFDIALYNHGGFPIDYRHPQLEYGNVATDWSPAPEDVDDAIDSIEVGGRNLLHGTANPIKSSTWGYDTWTVSSGGNGVGTIETVSDSPVAGVTKSFRITGNSSGNRDFGQYNKTIQQDLTGTYRFTAWVRGIGGSVDAYVRVWDSTSGKQTFAEFITATTSWTKVDINFDPDLASSPSVGNALSVRIGMTGSGSVEWIAPKLEKGNKATDWSPAPEDVDSAISNAAKTATSYVTDITGGGIMVHPSSVQNTGVQVTSDVDILRSGTSVANYGSTARIGTLAGKHVSIDSDSVDLMDGSTDLATFGANETHLGLAGAGRVYMADDKFLLSAETTEGETVEVVSGLHAQNIGTNYRVYSGIESTLVYDDDGQQTTSTTVIEAKVDNGDGSALDWANIRIFVDPVNKTKIALTCEEIGLDAYDVWLQDPYGDATATLQLGKPVQRSASSNVSITSTNTWVDGPTVSLDAGYWLVVGVACFNSGSSSGSRKLRAQLRLGSSVYAEGTEVCVATNEYGRIQASAVMYVSSTSNVTLVLSSSMTFTSATTSYVTAVRLA